MRARKVCIIGFAAIKELIPWGERNTEFWGFNELYRRFLVGGFHRWFELHTVTYDRPGEIPGYFRAEEWIRHAGVLREIARLMPLYTPFKATVRGATVYPRKRVEALCPHGAYHAGSFDWMVALAILERFKEIHIYGADFALGGEPISARPCLEYWLGVAEGRGIKTVVHGGDCFRIFHLTRSDRAYGFEPFALVEDTPIREK